MSTINQWIGRSASILKRAIVRFKDTLYFPQISKRHIHFSSKQKRRASNLPVQTGRSIWIGRTHTRPRENDKWNSRECRVTATFGGESAPLRAFRNVIVAGYTATFESGAFILARAFYGACWLFENRGQLLDEHANRRPRY